MLRTTFVFEILLNAHVPLGIELFTADYASITDKIFVLRKLC